MELSDSKIKNFLYFRKWDTAIFSPSSKKSTPREFLVLLETENPKKKFIFFQKKAFFIFRGTETPKKFFIFQETQLSYISGNPKQLSETKK